MFVPWSWNWRFLGVQSWQFEMRIAVLWLLTITVTIHMGLVASQFLHWWNPFSPSKVGGCNGSHPRRILGLSDGQGKAQCSGSTSLAKHGDLMDIIIKHPETMGHFNWYFDICDKKMIIQLVRFIRLLLRQVRGWLVVVDISWKMKMANGSVGELRLAKWRWGPPLVMLDDPNGTSTENQ